MCTWVRSPDVTSGSDLIKTEVTRCLLQGLIQAYQTSPHGKSGKFIPLTLMANLAVHEVKKIEKIKTKELRLF